MKLSRKPHIEVVIPVFNEVDNLLPLISGIDASAKQLATEARLTYLFVNDGSRDGSRELLSRLASERTDLRVIHLIHNFGHGAALTCGLDSFDADIAVFMDADGQDSPEVIPALYDGWKQGAKTVVAERGARPENAGILFKSFYYLLHRINKRLPPISFGTFSLMDRSVVERVRKMPERDRYFPGLVAFASQDLRALRVDRKSRQHGESRVGSLGLLNLAITAFLSFSSVPIRMVSVLGIVCSASAILGGIGIVCIRLFTDLAIPGWASVTSLIFFVSGMQLLCLGIIGEYIARIFEEVKSRPLYWTEKEEKHEGQISRLAPAR